MELLLDAIETNPPVMQLAGLFTINRNILVQVSKFILKNLI